VLEVKTGSWSELAPLDTSFKVLSKDIHKPVLLEWFNKLLSGICQIPLLRG